MVDDQAARALHLRVRVLCWLPSTKARLEGALKAVNETWGRRCDGRVYFVNTGHTANDVVDVGGLDGYDYLSSKSAAALKYLYHHHLHHYDWFIKGEDDTYIIVENLKLLLSHYNASSPVHLGTGYFNDHLPGGASYVLSREALRRVNEEGYRKGRDCCSQLTISFHKLDPELMRVFDHLLYRTSVYGRLQDLSALSGLISPGVVRERVRPRNKKTMHSNNV
ncbi:hypothetical protein C0Q70_14773 [Pomacea canaliculata]|uniref:N-acetylgalactosaminide beta-1,3-galactosyltransferase n=1 Tax=Pomacea canaliculata TaxID=400727 RepID=A0A2T7NT20_POMCA|nr:hypothetical protein C0Q70_14773 [Pomacea canaliculata]